MDKTILITKIAGDLGYSPKGKTFVKTVDKISIHPESGEIKKTKETVELPEFIKKTIEDTITHIQTLAQITGNLTYTGATGGLVTGTGGSIPGPVVAALMPGPPVTGAATMPPASIK